MSDCGNVKKVFTPVDDEKQEEVRGQFFSGIKITDKAEEKILHFCKVKGEDSNQVGLMVVVRNDGCSGKSYDMDLASISEAKAAGNKIFVQGKATVIVEKSSYLFCHRVDIRLCRDTVDVRFSTCKP